MTKDKSSKIHIGEIIIKRSDCEKLLGVKIDSNKTSFMIIMQKS